MTTIDLKTPVKQLEDFLRLKSWLEADEFIKDISKPGEGNMNVVLRVKTNQRSLILKQSRPFVQKYQEIKAPLNRIEVEQHFYSTMANSKVKHHFPKIHYYDKENYLMVLEDLGECKDMSLYYNTGSFSLPMIETLVEVLNNIHSRQKPKDYPLNKELRALNHQHIFVLPFLNNNGFTLDSVQQGLQNLSLPYKNDPSLKEVVNSIGEIYLSEGDVLLHGDYYPGSWMQKEEEIFIIDPEFSFIGFREFDLGVMLAHVLMANMEEQLIDHILGIYSANANIKLVKQVAGIEIIRRIIGLAQLPLQRSLLEKDYLLQIARKMILK